MPRTHRSPASRIGGSGHRQGKRGTGYSNRSDLNSGVASPFTPQLLDTSSGALPSAQMLPPGAATGPPPGAAMMQGPDVAAMAPPKVAQLADPTSRPYEPVTAGLALNNGANIQSGLVPDNATIMDALKGSYSQHPDDDLRAMIEQLAGQKP